MTNPPNPVWQTISEHLDHLLELSDEDRERYVAGIERDDAAAARELRNLLGAERDARFQQFLGGQASLAADASAAAALIGRRVGPYVIEAEVGHGGMGSVWRARRADGRFEGQAAIKFIHPAWLGGMGEERFRLEGRLLARLDHPNIARLLDAGMLDDRQPYLVLEFVEGEPIDSYCERRSLDLQDRIRLFIDVLAAVGHAHSHLIVHRDLKPSNILVTADGTVKLLDFGIAKLVRDDAGGAPLTKSSAHALTPEYAAPEQLLDKPVTTAADVYALGLVLYILLTGVHPLRSGTRSSWELYRSIVTEDPPRASVAAIGPIVRGRALQGDLDNIIAKALKKEPTDRYPTTGAFANDLKRFLAHEPVSARPNTVAYHAGKFLRRNRVVVAVISIAIALVIGSLAVGLSAANGQRRLAERRFAQVRQLANKFITLDNDIRGLPGSTKVRMEMVSDSLQYLTSLGSDVHGDQDLALEVAYAYVRVAHAQGDPTSPNLGLYTGAQHSLDQAQRFVDSVLSGDPQNPRALFIATTIAHDRMELANQRDDRPETLRYAAAAAALIERFLSTRPTDFHDIYSMRYFYSNVAGAYFDSRRFADAIRYGQRGLDIPLSSNLGNGFILLVMASARWQSGDLDGAVKFIDQGISIQQGEAAGGHATLRINLASGYEVRGLILGRADAEPSFGRGGEALAELQKAADIAEDLAGKDASDYLARHQLATAALEIGNILRYRDPGAALAVYDHALARIHELSGNVATRRDEADLLAASSYPLRWMDREGEARQRIAAALDALKRNGRYPTSRIEPMSESYDALRAQADDYAQNGQTGEAIDAYLRLLDGLQAWKPDVESDLRDATCMARTWTALAQLESRAGHAEEASLFEARRTKLWDLWSGKLAGAEFLLRQSLTQIDPPGAALVAQRSAHSARPSDRRLMNNSTTPTSTTPTAIHSPGVTISPPRVTPRRSATSGFTRV